MNSPLYRYCTVPPYVYLATEYAAPDPVMNIISTWAQIPLNGNFVESSFGVTLNDVLFPINAYKADFINIGLLMKVNDIFLNKGTIDFCMLTIVIENATNSNSI
jgi:hypothetical protein